ncbi:MAG: FG-GAP-like repeat-containing protein, partial [Pseudomonadota bacterium]
MKKRVHSFNISRFIRQVVAQPAHLFSSRLSAQCKFHNSRSLALLFALGLSVIITNSATYAAGPFVTPPRSEQPFAAPIDVGSESSPALVDLDNDNDLDLVLGAADGQIYYYQNVGTATIPNYEPKLLEDNPFNEIDVGEGSIPALADLDDDRDLDMLVGGRTGAIRYYENTGTVSIPRYEEKTSTDNPFADIDVGDNSSPALADLDGDG